MKNISDDELEWNIRAMFVTRLGLVSAVFDILEDMWEHADDGGKQKLDKIMELLNDYDGIEREKLRKRVKFDDKPNILRPSNKKPKKGKKHGT